MREDVGEGVRLRMGEDDGEGVRLRMGEDGGDRVRRVRPHMGEMD